MFWASQAFSLGLPERLFKASRLRFFGLHIFGQRLAQHYPAAPDKTAAAPPTN
jgi:hypothetical protein